SRCSRPVPTPAHLIAKEDGQSKTDGDTRLTLGNHCSHPPFILLRSACNLLASLRPGALSTPLLTSTAKGSTARIASTMLSGDKPPARKTLVNFAASRATAQLAVLPVPPYNFASKASSRIADAG